MNLSRVSPSNCSQWARGGQEAGKRYARGGQEGVRGGQEVGKRWARGGQDANFNLKLLRTSRNNVLQVII